MITGIIIGAICFLVWTLIAYHLPCNKTKRMKQETLREQMQQFTDRAYSDTYYYDLKRDKKEGLKLVANPDIIILPVFVQALSDSLNTIDKKLSLFSFEEKAIYDALRPDNEDC